MKWTRNFIQCRYLNYAPIVLTMFKKKNWPSKVNSWFAEAYLLRGRDLIALLGITSEEFSDIGRNYIENFLIKVGSARVRRILMISSSYRNV
jgi:hypothetical protein